MKGIQTPHNDLSRNSLVNRKLKESPSKNGKIAKKNLAASLTTSVAEDASPELASPELTKNLTDSPSSMISEISDANYSSETAESLFLFESSANWLIPTPTPSDTLAKLTLPDLGPSLTINTKEATQDIELNGQNNTKIRHVDIELDDTHNDMDLVDKLILAKLRVLLICFFVWVIVVSVIFFWCSGSQDTFHGYVPT